MSRLGPKEDMPRLRDYGRDAATFDIRIGESVVPRMAINASAVLSRILKYYD